MDARSCYAFMPAWGWRTPARTIRGSDNVDWSISSAGTTALQKLSDSASPGGLNDTTELCSRATFHPWGRTKFMRISSEKTGTLHSDPDPSPLG